MTHVEPMSNISNLNNVITWMKAIFAAFESGKVDKKSVASKTKKTLALLQKFTPEKKEKEDYDLILDLCISLSTINRSQGNFEKFYLKSLKTNLEEIEKSLLVEKNE